MTEERDRFFKHYPYNQNDDEMADQNNATTPDEADLTPTTESAVNPSPVEASTASPPTPEDSALHYVSPPPSHPTYDHAYNQTPPLPAGPPPKKRKWTKTILITVASLFAVAVIALASIGAYTLINPAQPADTSTTTDAPVVSKTNSGNALSISEIAEKVSPSVVSIISTIPVADNFFFGMESEQQGTGSGIIMTADGYILTNAHVVSGATKIDVTLEDGTSHAASLVGADSQTDVAVLKIEAKDLPAAEFGDSSSLKVGDEVVIIGNPLGTELTNTVQNGIVSYLDREISVDGQTRSFIQTNAGINAGNSGGPLVNAEGLVVGLNTAKVDSSVAEGIGFALPINDVLPIANELIENGYIGGRPLIGISGQDMDERSAQYYSVPTGVLVAEVTEGTGADKAGIEVQDIITKINGVEISSMDELNTEKDSYQVGDTITLTVYRHSSGETFEVKVVLGEQTT